MVGAPPWSKLERQRLVQRVRTLADHRAKSIDCLPLGPLWAFVGYQRDELLDHLLRRHRQGCLICGDIFARDDRFEICHIDPLAEATNGVTLQRLMALTNIGLAHIECNMRLGARRLQ